MRRNHVAANEPMRKERLVIQNSSVRQGKSTQRGETFKASILQNAKARALSPSKNFPFSNRMRFKPLLEESFHPQADTIG